MKQAIHFFDEKRTSGFNEASPISFTKTGCKLTAPIRFDKVQCDMHSSKKNDNIDALQDSLSEEKYVRKIVHIAETNESKYAFVPEKYKNAKISNFSNEEPLCEDSPGIKRALFSLATEYNYDTQTYAEVRVPDELRGAMIEVGEKKEGNQPETKCKLVSESTTKKETAMIKPSVQNQNEKVVFSKTANFTLHPIKLVQEIAVDGKVTGSYVEYQVNVGSRKVITLEMPEDELDNIVPYTKKNIRYAYVSNTKEIHSITDKFRMETENLYTEDRVSFSGWFHKDRQHFYVLKGQQIRGIINNSEAYMDIDNRYYTDPLAVAQNILNLSSNVGVNAILLAYVFSGIFYDLFVNAGFPIQFLLFLHGKTGSFKTAIAKALFQHIQFGDERDKIRRLDMDTTNSIGVAFKSGRSTVMIFDDFRPPKTQKEDALLKANIEVLIRAFGDGVNKARTNPKLKDVRLPGPMGTAVVTGESKNKGLSSQLRCVFLELEQKMVNQETLTWFQNNEKAVPSMVMSMISYIASHWDRMVGVIKNSFPNYRMNLKGLFAGKRQIDSAATLLILLDLVSLWDRDLLHGMLFLPYSADEIKKMMVAELAESAKNAKEEEPGEKYFSAIRAMIQQKTVVIKETKADCDLSFADGYINRGFVYLSTEKVLPKVKNHIRSLYDECYESIDIILDELAKSGYIELSRNGKKPDGTVRYQYYFEEKIGGYDNVKCLKISQQYLVNGTKEDRGKNVCQR